MKNEIVIYTITSLYTDTPDADGMKLKLKDLDFRTSLVGIYKTLEKAKQCVEEDWPHFDECGYYNYIVIEGLEEGCYPGMGDNEYWYHHDYDNQKWRRCEKPNCFKQMVNFYG